MLQKNCIFLFTLREKFLMNPNKNINKDLPIQVNFKAWSIHAHCKAHHIDGDLIIEHGIHNSKSMMIPTRGRTQWTINRKIRPQRGISKPRNIKNNKNNHTNNNKVLNIWTRRDIERLVTFSIYLFLIGAVNPKAFEVINLSMGRPVPANAQAPRGQKFNRSLQLTNRLASRSSWKHHGHS